MKSSLHRALSCGRAEQREAAAVGTTVGTDGGGAGEAEATGEKNLSPLICFRFYFASFLHVAEIPHENQFVVDTIKIDHGTMSYLEKIDFLQGNLLAAHSVWVNDNETHGILNAVSWGLLFPIGAIIARYVRTIELADPVWFDIHVACQISGYAIGVVGWATGLQLGTSRLGLYTRAISTPAVFILENLDYYCFILALAAILLHYC
ncbi:uncharacterized protein [Spinacia oleracea]|uniref:Uncharacterized protein isoform X2 n=1 Tax=Spinacia oleracea TaxID=3562 RepID=A0A9R0HRN6_SPIOL|nr:uncharacterized protein LOC110774902 isoform X2 [Spinacia oleracea]